MWNIKKESSTSPDPATTGNGKKESQMVIQAASSLRLRRLLLGNADSGGGVGTHCSDTVEEWFLTRWSTIGKSCQCS
ncbi:unnamed protein product [Amoebophrya sp. A25]|nr:unnamed protein product [Amoebophrya sp. A25]|eukprot:GSA25T00006555001.1